MISLLLAFFSSFLVTMLIIRYEHLHSHISHDSNTNGPQKFHHKIVPRIGGIGIFIGIFLAVLSQIKSSNQFFRVELVLFICTIPTFAIGLAEDFTKKISVRTRLFFTSISAIAAVHFLNAYVAKVDNDLFDSYLFSFTPIAIAFTVFAISGLANAYNIIDGFNGLSSMVGIITLFALGYVSFTVGDTTLLRLSLVMASAIFGFLIWNYPRGLIFLGDGGAYLIGFWIAVLSVLLVTRNPLVSPWFALMVNGYPILETLFTIYRRKIHQGKNPGLPDGIHLHSLIYRRILSPSKLIKDSDNQWANSKTAPYLWFLTTVSIIPAIIWWNSTPLLICSAITFGIGYVWLYKKIVCFRTPKWMDPY
jgi:UDP-N-acetylmuramyl pentapeptide phosphotransferase/UDP-N-acetylglucosamine-1-phosphate transferase